MAYTKMEPPAGTGRGENGARDCLNNPAPIITSCPGLLGLVLGGSDYITAERFRHILPGVSFHAYIHDMRGLGWDFEALENGAYRFHGRKGVA